MLTLYSYPNSRSLRVAWTLEELELDYRIHSLDLKAGEGRSPEYLAIHPDGKAPAIVEGELVLFESSAICRYLAAREGRLIPSSLEGQAQLDQWLSFLTTELEQPLWTLAKHTFALPEERRCEDVKQTAQWEFQRALGALQRRFEGQGWLLGDDFTLADLFLAQVLGWAHKAQQPIPSSLARWMQEALARPACARAREREAQAAANRP
ncbi:glutathione S-transferase family protein [Cobetia marina]|uniref:glutathione S-transferase family protein n=1 Tax=Cobetia TaxID=204286 RepID=UPI002448A96C|nr:MULTISPECIES: glutathione S-transferase family protein [Cobetia]MDH2374305.1 glutathione S-transferase family protein [Cobetia sp. 3AK]MDO6787461.1 glutathione S-transferase family protein [Cobetia marina]